MSSFPARPQQGGNTSDSAHPPPSTAQARETACGHCACKRLPCTSPASIGPSGRRQQQQAAAHRENQDQRQRQGSKSKTSGLRPERGNLRGTPPQSPGFPSGSPTPLLTPPGPPKAPLRGAQPPKAQAGTQAGEEHRPGPKPWQRPAAAGTPGQRSGGSVSRRTAGAAPPRWPWSGSSRVEVAVSHPGGEGLPLGGAEHECWPCWVFRVPDGDDARQVTGDLHAC